MKLLQNRHDHLAEVKAHKSALNESRQNLSTLINDAYYASHNADDISTVEHITIEIDSSVTQMSLRLNALADSDNDWAEQDSLLIKEETPKTVRSLRTLISHLQRREITVTIKNKNARKQLQRKLMLRVLPVYSSLTRAKRA